MSKDEFFLIKAEWFALKYPVQSAHHSIQNLSEKKKNIWRNALIGRKACMLKFEKGNRVNHRAKP